ncbi:glutathione S-transferase family protein [Phenylobacterium sp. VNQ135]|uniref:glutathione S-transferase family protein n=1 Tax=Phenylobacterium sp. VNQ135 TaxID=3400922 RepID=UPI003C2E38BD
MRPYILYGVWSSYYTGKVRSYLRKKGLPFVERLPAAPEYRSDVRGKAGTHHIPVLVAPDGTVVQDSTLILDYLEDRHPDPPMTPQTPVLRLAAMMLEVFGQEGLTRPAMHYRWSFLEENRDYILHDFGRALKPRGTQAEIEAAGGMVAERMSGKLPGLGITEQTIPVVEAEFEALLGLLDAHFGAHPYLLGGRPSRGDFGLMAPMFAHLSRDPYPAMVLRRHGPATARWIEQMNVPELAMPEFEGLSPDYPPDDRPPETLLPVLRFFVETHGAEVAAIADSWAEWLQADPMRRPGTQISESAAAQPVLDPRPVRIRDTVFTISPRLHTLWMFQRPLDFFAAQTGPARAACEAFAAAIGAGQLLNLTLERPLRRDGGRLLVG